MDPFGSISTGGGGLSGGSSEASLTSRSDASFGGWGQGSYNFGSGTLSANTPNWWVIGGVALAGLTALYLWKRKG